MSLSKTQSEFIAASGNLEPENDIGSVLRNQEIEEATNKYFIHKISLALVPGTTVLFGRNTRHLIENTGETDLKLLWVFFPPALEYWFRAIGQTRTPGDPMPEVFQRPDNVSEIMEQMKFVPPRAAADT
jgi:hypothetical protein